MHPGEEREHAGKVCQRGNGGGTGEASPKNTGKLPFPTGFYSEPNKSTYIKKRMNNKQQLQQLLEELSTVTKEMAHPLRQEIFDHVEYDDYRARYGALICKIDELNAAEG